MLKSLGRSVGRLFGRLPPLAKRGAQFDTEVKTTSKVLQNEGDREHFWNKINECIKKRNGFDILGEVRSALQAGAQPEWKLRDINRLLTRHREDRPIEDARLWARFALLFAMLAFLCSGIADFPQALRTMGLLGSASDQERTAAQLKELRETLTADLKDVRADLRTVPDTLAHIDRWITQRDQRDAVLDGQLKDFRETLTADLKDVRADLRTVPDTLAHIDRWITQRDQRDAVLDGQLKDLLRSEAELRASGRRVPRHQ